jgi:hypothetical protein
MLVLSVALSENEDIMEQDDLAVDVLDENMERFGTSVDFCVPLEIGDDRKVDSEERTRDGLNLSLKPTKTTLLAHDST